MFRLIVANVIAIFVFSSAAAADLTRWTISGAEAKVCTEATGGSCVTLTCGASGNVLLRINGGGVRAGQTSIFVDGQLIGSGSFGGSQGTAQALLNPRSNDDIFARLAAGSRLRVNAQGASVDVSLAGSAAAISAVTSACTGRPPPVSPEGNRWQQFLRLEDENSARYEPPPPTFAAFSLHRGLDVWGGDIRTGLSDPALRDISQDQCAQLCLATSGCGAFTHNSADGDVCFLKSGSGEMTAYAGATTGVRSLDVTSHIPPPTRGPLPIVNETVAWAETDQPDAHASRTRAISRGLGKSCEAERVILDDLIQDISIAMPIDRVSVGQPVSIEWTGNTLSERIPVWIVVSSPDLVRFDQANATVLGEDAPNPFGLLAGQDETRALISLWGRGAGEAGHVDIIPLEAGDLDVTVSVVTYLRACEEEATLWSLAETLDVLPSAATLVVGTETGRADLTHQADLSQFNRHIEFNDIRFRLTTLSEGTEIVERDGTNIRLSPTGRFLLVDDSEVVDVVDGSTVGFVDGPFYWAGGDSFLLGTQAPWGQVDLLSTFGARQIVDDQITGPSCCPATPEATHLSLDLENGVFTVRGTLGHSIGPLQGQTYSNETAGSGYNSGTYWVGPTQEIAMHSLAPVAPILLAEGFSLPSREPVGSLLMDRASERPKQNNNEEIVVASLFRGVGEEAISAFERIGIQLAEGRKADDVLPTVAEAQYIEDVASLSPDQATEVERRLNEIGQPVNWDFDLVPTPPGNYNSSDCLHFIGPRDSSEAEFTNQSVFGRDGAVLLPEDVQQILVLGEGEGALLIGRLECVAGATLGALRGSSSVFVTELIEGEQPDDMRTFDIITSGYATAQFTQSFTDHPISARVFGRKLLLVSPGQGRAVLFDLDDRNILHEWESLPSGNLLEDAFLTVDQDYMVQINSDGGFFLHRAIDGRRVLSGRLVSDEIAVWTNDFQYDATAEAATLIDLRFPGIDEQFSLDRFGSLLRYRGLVDAVLTGATIPSERVDLPPALTGHIVLENENDIVAKAELDPERGGVELQLYQDGVLTDTVDLSANANEAEIRSERLPGTRYASLLVVSERGLASNAISADLGPEIVGGTRRALAVAVDIYNDPLLPDLNFAKADADRFTQTLSNLPEGVPSFDEPVFQVGRRVTPSSVLDALDQSLDGLGEADHFVFYLAGHGLRSDEGEFYLALSQTDPSDLDTTALAWRDISARLRTTSARVTILIDACHSGAAGLGTFATNDNILSDLSGLPTNLTIIAASKGRQQSIEARSQEGGLFTVAVERVLTTERQLHDTNGNGRIEANELSNGVQFIVSTQSEGRQVPWMTKGRIVGDYSLF